MNEQVDTIFDHKDKTKTQVMNLDFDFSDENYDQGCEYAKGKFSRISDRGYSCNWRWGSMASE